MILFEGGFGMAISTVYEAELAANMASEKVVRGIGDDESNAPTVARSEDEDDEYDEDEDDDQFDAVNQAIGLVGRTWRDVDGVEINMQPCEWFECLSDEQCDQLEDWASDVISTVEDGRDLSANGGMLRVVPELLAAELKPADDVPNIVPSGELPVNVPVPVSESSKAETCDEARIRIEGMIPVALSMFDDAKEIAASRKAAHDAAKKNVDIQQDQINELFRELADALRGVAGGEYQTRLPFDRSEVVGDCHHSDLTGQLTLPIEAVSADIDPTLGWAVHVLTRDQLAAKTNGQSNDTGITDAIADSLVNNSINTIGDLEAHQRRVGQHWHKPLKAIGEGKADLIRDALAALRRTFPMLA